MTKVGKIVAAALPVPNIRPVAGLDALGSSVASDAQELEMICHQPEPPPGAAPHKFRAKQLSDVEYTADCEFMEHIVKVIVANHSIKITPQDIEDILSYFGEVNVKTQMVEVQSRDVDLDVGCFGCGSAEQKKEAIEVVKSVVLNGLNVLKSLPDLVGFLGGIGVRISSIGKWLNWDHSFHSWSHPGFHFVQTSEPLSLPNLRATFPP
jgi:hypothetical protein